MDLLYKVIGTPLGWIMWLCYQLTTSYGFSLFLFTLITRAAMFPMTLKQQKSTAKMTMLRPQMEQLQKKYENNKEKLNEETMKLYQKEGYNPMSGCLPLLIQLPILFGLIDVIYRPLKHILRLPADIITVVEQIVLDMGLVPALSGLNHAQIKAIQAINENVTPFIEIGQDNIDKILSLNMNFFGINLGLTPEYSMFTDIFTGGGFNPLLLVPILSGLSALASSLITMRTSAASTEGQAGGGTMKGMMLIMPIFSLMIAFSVPAGVGIYWFYSNVIAIAQSLLLNKFYNPKEMAEKAQKEFEERQERERQERIEAKKLAKQAVKEARTGKDSKGSKDSKEPSEAIVIDEKALTQKELNRRKLAEARRRDAERYGEEYVEVTDEDLK